ncbi:hypothetical protein DEU56DRAFT_755684 [Suillus clintonianus]|uniref:uncharacterized protein n=1 Tax=Suillus clintonianus TaxID=1904413 RepID=UPI001B87A341|nr:uncharacterized protein DEU56DRAFT_755684 [Suillus clintonianus]KAG2138966.1 hypothetical protein DEU56DRAFT_755684 [Suillus clintonianus]
MAACPKDAGFYKKELTDWDVTQKRFKVEMDDYDKEEQSKLGVKHSIKFCTGYMRDWFNDMSPAQWKEVENVKDKWNKEGGRCTSRIAGHILKEKLSKRKDLDVDYVFYKPTTSRSKKSSWVESCVDPLYETSVEPSSSSSSPRKHIREDPAEPPDAEAYQECFSDLFLDTEAGHQPRTTKICLGTQNDFIAEYLDYRDVYLDIILGSETFARAGICETCQSAEATFNCVTCTGDHGWCHPCLIRSHQSLPFHKIQFWNNMCFHDVTLAQLGFIWYLGHGESLVLHMELQKWMGIKTREWMMLHMQLLSAGLFPASSMRPRTAFTFEVLDHFLIDTLKCKTSARSFYEKLTLLTNNTCPDTVPDQYHELMRVSRLWRDLKNRKWFKFGHDTESRPGPGDLALFCPSCPQPGINMLLHWKEKYERQVNYYYLCKATIARQRPVIWLQSENIKLTWPQLQSREQTQTGATSELQEWGPRLVLNMDVSFPTAYLNFIAGAGQVNGEILETLWAPFNKISPTACFMSQAHCQEILDNHMWNSNWKKLVQIIKMLLQKYKCLNKGIADTKVPFEELTSSLEVSKVSSWEKDETQVMEQRGEHLDIIQLKIDKGKCF